MLILCPGNSALSPHAPKISSFSPRRVGRLLFYMDWLNLPARQRGETSPFIEPYKAFSAHYEERTGSAPHDTRKQKNTHDWFVSTKLSSVSICVIKKWAHTRLHTQTHNHTLISLPQRSQFWLPVIAQDSLRGGREFGVCMRVCQKFLQINKQRANWFSHLFPFLQAVNSFHFYTLWSRLKPLEAASHHWPLHGCEWKLVEFEKLST